MHAIWLSTLVPVLIAAIWIWPKLRASKVWFALFLVAFLGTAIWVGNDLNSFIESNGSTKNVWLRTLYLFLSEPDKPLLQLTLGLFMATLFSRRLTGLDSNETSPVTATDE